MVLNLGAEIELGKREGERDAYGWKGYGCVLRFMELG